MWKHRCTMRRVRRGEGVRKRRGHGERGGMDEEDGKGEE